MELRNNTMWPVFGRNTRSFLRMPKSSRKALSVLGLMFSGRRSRPGPPRRPMPSGSWPEPRLPRLNANRRERAADWRRCLGADGCSHKAKPTKLAYRWLKGLQGWQHSTVAQANWNDNVQTEHNPCDEATIEDDPDRCDPHSEYPTFHIGSVPLSDQAVVDKEAEDWAGLWQEGQSYNNLHFGSLEAAPPTSPEQIRKAALSFPIHTGLGADNVAPRAIARLSDEALIALTLLFQAFEKCGQWCGALNLVLIVLLPKPDGGRRPIGFFPTLIRIWMRTRLLFTRAWEACHTSESVFAGPDMGAHKASWQSAFAAEAASLGADDHAQALIDLVKAFETVPHDVLFEAARIKGYPLWLLRLSLAAHRLARSVGVDGVYSRFVFASRGISAGSGFATTEFKMMMIDLVNMLQGTWASTFITKVFVDDLTLSVTGTPKLSSM